MTHSHHTVGKFFALPFLFLKNAETSLLRMRLFVVRFGYIAVFADDIRDDERTIWQHTRVYHKAHARWGRGGPTITGPRCRGSTGGRGGPSPTAPPPQSRSRQKKRRPCTPGVSLLWSMMRVHMMRALYRPW
jgi:hypothetical protein